MVEYAGITAAITLLVSSLSGVAGSIAQLPLNEVRATALVATAARSHHVSGPEAQAAYANAPYHKPLLRYVYAVSWVAAASDRAACKAALLLGPKPSEAAVQAIRRTPKLLVRLRAAHLTLSQAAAAMGRGTTDGCA